MACNSIEKILSDNIFNNIQNTNIQGDSKEEIWSLKKKEEVSLLVAIISFLLKLCSRLNLTNLRLHLIFRKEFRSSCKRTGIIGKLSLGGRSSFFWNPTSRVFNTTGKTKFWSDCVNHSGCDSLPPNWPT